VTKNYARAVNKYSSNNGVINIQDKASLTVPKEYMFVPSSELHEIARFKGGKFSSNLQGVIMPTDGLTMYLIFVYYYEGYVSDKNRKKLNDPTFLEKNLEETNRKFAPLNVKRIWNNKPQYDFKKNLITWSYDYTTVINTDSEILGRKESVVFLGRQGCISLTANGEMSEAKKNDKYFKEVVKSFRFNPEERYENYRDNKDKGVKYTIDSLLTFLQMQ
jgi:uncharacterized membrane-anchored protein